MRRFEYDYLGNVLEASEFDANGDSLATGVAHTSYLYDSRGNVREIRYFDKFRRPVADQVGCVSIQHEYDIFGEKVKTECLALDGSVVKEL